MPTFIGNLAEDFQILPEGFRYPLNNPHKAFSSLPERLKALCRGNVAEQPRLNVDWNDIGSVHIGMSLTNALFILS